MVVDKGPRPWRGPGLSFRDEQCPKRAPGLSHTQDGSIYCVHCGAMVAVRGSEPGSFEQAVQNAAFIAGGVRCAFLLCSTNADIAMDVVSQPNGERATYPLCHLCWEDLKVAHRLGLPIMLSPEGVLWVNVYSPSSI